MRPSRHRVHVGPGSLCVQLRRLAASHRAPSRGSAGSAFVPCFALLGGQRLPDPVRSFRFALIFTGVRHRPQASRPVRRALEHSAAVLGGPCFCSCQRLPTTLRLRLTFLRITGFIPKVRHRPQASESTRRAPERLAAGSQLPRAASWFVLSRESQLEALSKLCLVLQQSLRAFCNSDLRLAEHAGQASPDRRSTI
jgi:hypothetical protein